MIHPIVKYGDPVLETPTKPIEKFDEEIAGARRGHVRVHVRRQGVGLAAPQIGIGLRVAVIDVSNGKNPEAKIVCANPEIIHAEGEQREEEGCLSVPGFRGHVARPQYVTVRAQDAPARNSKCAAKDCWHARSATRSTISTELFSSRISACSSAT